MQKWLSKVGPYQVEHLPLPYFHGPVSSRFDDRGERLKGVQHTTEGSTLEGALSAYRSKGFTPTFTLGRDSRGRVRILQHKPLGIMGSTLANPSGGTQTNAYALVQIELVGFSKRTRWLPDRKVLDALAALYAELFLLTGLPLRKVDARRDRGKWERGTGWFGHVDVPENFHWDSGALNYAAIFERARGYLGRHNETPPERLPSWYWPWVEWRLGEGRFKRFPPRKGPRPLNVPARIPPWAWKKLAAFLKARKRHRRTDAVRTLPLKARARRAAPACDCAEETS